MLTHYADVVVANTFADFFTDVYYDSSSNVEAFDAYNAQFDGVERVDGYNIDKCLQSLLTRVLEVLNVERLVDQITSVRNTCNMHIRH